VDDADHRFRHAAAPRRGAPALFLDRDGTLIEDPGYLADPNGVRILPGVPAALRRFRDAGHALVIVTNQSGIGRGLYAWQDYDAVAARLRDLLAAERIAVDAEYACGHAPEAACTWRKPAAGMIRAAADTLGLDFGRSLMAGDKYLDIEAAAAAGLPRAVHVLTGQGRRDRAAVVATSWPLRLDLVDDLAGLVP
jgi:histidinol-phosphate phosphatase family protein